MSNRVTLRLEDVPYKLLRVMAAEENLSMSQIVTEFLVGDRQVISDEKEQERILEKNNLELSCQLELMTSPVVRCSNVGEKPWTAPDNYTLPGSYLLCEQHYKEVNV